MTPKLSTLAAALCLWFAHTATATPLQQILRHALQNDPTVLEARANEQAAQSSVKEARAGHYPTVSVTGTQILARHHRQRGDYDNKKFNPGLNANLNLYAFGGIESSVRQNQHKAEYYYHKIAETQEELGSTIGRLYLGALRAKELIIAAQNNIARHERIVSDLKIIAKHDKGRQSELDQALDRKLRAEAYLIEQTHQLESNLSRLGKYTGRVLTADDLEDPFIQDTQTSLIERYHNPDLANLPSYLAQQAEKESVAEEVNVAKAARYPRINLIGNADRDNRQMYVNLAWEFYNPAAKYNVERTAHSLTVAETRMDQILRDVAERSRNAQIDMNQYQRRYQLAQQQIASQQRVIKAYELQFKIARRTLIDVLDSYADLSNIEINAISAQNNYRDAALEYLVSQAAIGIWSGMDGKLGAGSNTQPIADKPTVLAQEKLTQTPTENTQNTQNSETVQPENPPVAKPQSNDTTPKSAPTPTETEKPNQEAQKVTKKQEVNNNTSTKTQPENLDDKHTAYPVIEVDNTSATPNAAKNVETHIKPNKDEAMVSTAITAQSVPMMQPETVTHDTTTIPVADEHNMMDTSQPIVSNKVKPTMQPESKDATPVAPVQPEINNHSVPMPSVNQTTIRQPEKLNDSDIPTVEDEIRLHPLPDKTDMLTVEGERTLHPQPQGPAILTVEEEARLFSIQHFGDAIAPNE